ncbi:rCG28887 [Rattus norvegicus]|uniref:RCG28887 n=1 Tax=Rattus norvegicus TaxID=10116 RepID=A6HWF9_RAT|nr:rCG28887 [Rattus norvegicus]
MWLCQHTAEEGIRSLGTRLTGQYLEDVYLSVYLKGSPHWFY